VWIELKQGDYMTTWVNISGSRKALKYS